MLHRPLLSVINAPHVCTSARPTAPFERRRSGGCWGVATFKLRAVLRTFDCPTLPRCVRHGGSHRSSDNRGAGYSRKGYLGLRTVTTPPQVRVTGATLHAVR